MWPQVPPIVVGVYPSMGMLIGVKINLLFSRMGVVTLRPSVRLW